MQGEEKAVTSQYFGQGKIEFGQGILLLTEHLIIHSPDTNVVLYTYRCFIQIFETQASFCH